METSSEAAAYYNGKGEYGKRKKFRRLNDAPCANKSAYVIFCSRQRLVFKNEGGNLISPSSSSTGLTVSELGRRWNGLSITEKEEYQHRALQDQERFMIEKGRFVLNLKSKFRGAPHS
jgi:hypothetical protein